MSNVLGCELNPVEQEICDLIARKLLAAASQEGEENRTRTEDVSSLVSNKCN